jgi:hypothetical protein
MAKRISKMQTERQLNNNVAAPHPFDSAPGRKVCESGPGKFLQLSLLFRMEEFESF